MTATRIFLLLLILNISNCYSQSNNSDSLIDKLRLNIQLQEQRFGAVKMNDENMLLYYSLLLHSSIKDLVKYTNDSNAFIRSYTFLGLLQKNVNKNIVFRILDKHKNDTATFTNKSTDLVIGWTVKQFMESTMRLKSLHKLQPVNYKKKIEQLKKSAVRTSIIKEFNYDSMKVEQFLKLDSLTIRAGKN